MRKFVPIQGTLLGKKAMEMIILSMHYTFVKSFLVEAPPFFYETVSRTECDVRKTFRKETKS